MFQLSPEASSLRAGRTRRQLKATKTAHRLQIGRMLLEHGLPLVAGTDGGSPGVPHLSLIVEIEQLYQLGMTPLDALSSATGQAAACLGLSDRGVLRAGLRADLIAVPDDPLRHLDLLRAPTIVMIGGRIAHRVQQHPPT